MKTSKIKVIAEVKDYTGQNGTTYYHNLEMENGDKINIGKKKQQQVGWELTYEILEEGQHEYNKAKAVMPEGKSVGVGKAPDLSVQKAIIYQNSYTQANAFCAQVGFDSQDKMEMLNQLSATADFIAKDIIAKSKEA